MTVPSPLVGDDATAAWADAVALAVNTQYEGDQSSVTAVTLSSIAAFAASASAVTFTLTATTRIRLYALAQFTMASGTNGAYYVRAGYNTGASVNFGSALFVTGAQAARTTVAVIGQASSASIEGTVLLAAGTYTAYAVVARSAGGGATDTSGAQYCSVTALGST